MTPEASPNRETTETSRALIILFPDSRTVGGPNYLSERELTPFEQKLRKTTETVIQWYKNNSYTVFGIVYGDTGKDNFCEYFPRTKFDRLIPISSAFESWTHELYKQEIPQIVSALNLNNTARAYVSGYHSTDCVAQMTAFLQDQGIDVKADLRLSDKLPVLQLLHMGRNATRHLDNDVALQDFQSWQWMKQEVEDEIRRRRIKPEPLLRGLS